MGRVNINSPWGVAVNPDGKQVYVTGNETLSVIDTAMNKVVATVPVDSCPIAVSVTPNGKKAYVTNEHRNTVSFIDTSSNTVTATVSVGQQPEDIAIG